MKKESCGCCEGTEKLTPLPSANRPGLSELAYRVGTHATFLETMKACLSNLAIHVPATDNGKTSGQVYPLSNLTTREASDPAIALLDAWAIIADVLTFYQERMANEGYLRTATEHRSILELARLVGYKLAPGVSSSVHLAFKLENGYEVEIPADTRAQSVPGPGESPQPFETAEPLLARTEWNTLSPRMSKPPVITGQTDTLYFEGVSTELAPNDPLLIVDEDNNWRVVARVQHVEPQIDKDRTKVKLVESPGVVLGAKFMAAVQKSVRLHMAKVPPGVTADKIKETLEAILAYPARDAETMSAWLRENVLPSLQASYDAMPERFTLLKPRTNLIVADLKDLLNSMPVPAPAGMQTKQLSAPILSTGQSSTLKSLAGSSQLNLQGSLLAPVSRYGLLNAASKQPSLQPLNAQRLPRSASFSFGVKGDAALQFISSTLNKKKAFLQAVAGATVTKPGKTQVFALRTTAPLFGSNASEQPLAFNTTTGAITQTGQWPVVKLVHSSAGREPLEDPNVVYLDNSYKGILPNSWIVVETEATTLTKSRTVIALARNPNAAITRDDYGISGATTRIELANPDASQQDPLWITTDFFSSTYRPSGEDFKAIRRTVVHAESEALALAEEPVEDLVQGDRVELGALFNDLEAGRWVIISGERSDILGTSGVMASELVMLAGIEHGYDPNLPGDSLHTNLILAEPLAYKYKRDTVTIYGNVTKATHGETRTETLGSGDGGRALQQFMLGQAPLTYLSAPTPSGAESTLQVRVNDILWHEADGLPWLGPASRGYVTSRDEEGRTTVIFGDGHYGTRLPTGSENVTARYRIGIGAPGNAAAEQISQLVTRPLGVKSVLNPLPASGGADADSPDQARRNTPLAVMALDRLVSVQDYADFARTFAGIGKASAVRLSEGRRQVVHVTVAGANDIPITRTSDLYLNLRQALHQFGDPFLPIDLDVREPLTLVLSARIRVLPDYLWESVEQQVRRELLAFFSFERRKLGQDVLLSEVIGVIQAVPGVAYADVDLLDSVSETEASNMDQLGAKLAILASQSALGRPKNRILVEMAHIDSGHFAPAQLAFFRPEMPDTIILQELT